MIRHWRPIAVTVGVCAILALAVVFAVRGTDRASTGRALAPGRLVAVSARLVMRFGIKPPMIVGLLLMTVALLLFARAPVDGSFVIDLLPSMILLGLGAGIGFNPIFLAAMSDVPQEESGLASGVVNTAFMMGGALGLAVLASLAASRTDSLLASGGGRLDALTGGYHVAFLIGAIFALAATLLGAALLRVRQQAPAHGVKSRRVPSQASRPTKKPSSELPGRVGYPGGARGSSARRGSSDDVSTGLLRRLRNRGDQAQWGDPPRAR